MAVTASPAIGRMARLLEVLAAQPQRWWTLAELSRSTSISKASAHSVLLALVDEGYVRRRTDPVSYVLGPALIDLGDSARQIVDVRSAAAPVLAELSDATGCTAMVGAVRGVELTVVSAISVPHPFGMDLQPGHRSHFAAPVGTVYAAWLPDGRANAWLDRAHPALNARQRKEYQQSLEVVRDRGYSVTVRGAGQHRATREATDDELDAGEVDVLGISAPVFGAGGALECSIALVDPPPGRNTAALGRTVMSAADQLTSMLGGTDPTAGTM
jgi:DNA-binding IclR family transcriptional regulator